MRNIELKQTCRMAPEQYDAFLDGKQVGYLRLRGGYFYVQCPGTALKDEVVLHGNPAGYSEFQESERQSWLDRAKLEIDRWLDRRDTASLLA